VDFIIANTPLPQAIWLVRSTIEIRVTNVDGLQMAGSPPFGSRGRAVASLPRSETV